MRHLMFFLFFAMITISSVYVAHDFIADQKRYQRVRTAFAEKEQEVKDALNSKGIKLSTSQIIWVAYKAEEELVLFAKNKTDESYKKIKTYSICSSSGVLGPKRKQGDLQVPEGFYHINRYNPSSSYYLSLGINYPNNADRKKSSASNLGGDIFIHGECVTIGCLPMTNDKIKEIYLYAIHAKNNGQSQVPVYIFPFKMTSENVATYKLKYVNRPDLLSFWNNLKIAYDAFQTEKKALQFTINGAGEYVF
jgi:murein L,D-transpeptidase YafK